MYPDSPNSSAEERKLVGLLRKALQPLLKDALLNPADTAPVVEKLSELAQAIEASKTPPVALEGVESRLEGVEKAVAANKPLTKVATDVNLTKVESVLGSIAATTKTTEEYEAKVHKLMTSAVIELTKARLQKITDPRDAQDYVNVRLTDGDAFYRAIDQLATAVQHGTTSFADAGGSPTRAQLDSSGAVKVNVVAGGGSGGTSSTFNAAFPGTGTAVGASDGTNMKPLSVDGSGNLKIAGSFSSTTANSNNSWGQALATTSGATGTIVNIASSIAGYKIRGFVVHGTGDGYWFVQVAGTTILSGRTRATQPTLPVTLPNPIPVTTASAVTLKVTNESGSTADYEGTLLGE